jgi:hypothetical protein
VRRAFRLLVAAGLVAFAAVGPVGASSGQPDRECGNGNISFSGPDSAWPPNHKPVAESITYSGGTMGDTLNTGGASDEEAQDAEGNYTEENGSGHTDTASDVSPRAATSTVDESGDPVTNTHAVRAERSGRGDGRTYTLTYEVDNAAGMEVCTGTFTVDVPHDMGGGNDA